MKTISLLKAVLSQDMNIFKYSVKSNSSKFKKLLFPFFLFAVMCISIGSYAYMIGKELAFYHLTYVMLSMFIIMVTIFSFIEGIYKSQGILFETRDNDLLFSLPIKKSQILFVRIVKLLLFQFIYNLMFLLPAFVVYIYFEKPTINFYIVSLVMILLIPIIPTVISSVLGYVIKLLSSKFKFKKIVQTLLSSVIFLIIFYLCMNLDGFIQNIISKATSINEMLINFYYPLGIYINLIDKFEILEMLKLILINLVPLVLFVFLGSKFYFKIISNYKSDMVNHKINKRGKYVIKRRPIVSLIRKELKRYFFSPVYMFNTSFGLLLCVIVTIILCFKGETVFDTILVDYGINGNLSLPIIFYFFILFVCSMTSITSSSVSLEGKTINITKSLPIDEKTILNSKILTCYVIELPFILLGEVLFFIKFKLNLFYIVLIILLGILMILLNACIGLIANLKYPKMNAISDTEIVKQSMSSMISIFIGMGIFIGSILIAYFLNKYLELNLILILHVIFITITNMVLYKVLMKVGVREYKKLNV